MVIFPFVLEFMKLNARPGRQFLNAFDFAAVSIYGHSTGGGAAVVAAARIRVATQAVMLGMDPL